MQDLSHSALLIRVGDTQILHCGRPGLDTFKAACCEFQEHFPSLDLSVELIPGGNHSRFVLQSLAGLPWLTPGLRAGAVNT